MLSSILSIVYGPISVPRNSMRRLKITVNVNVVMAACSYHAK